MRNILLLGAGFTKNWGGWLASEVFEYLLGCPEINQNPRLLSILWKYQETGFEKLLAELHEKMNSFSDGTVTESEIKIFETAIQLMFQDMNIGLSRDQDWDVDLNLTRNFLTKFDAIFTLNQDLLLEQHYFNDNVMLLSTPPKKWGSVYLPGIEKLTPYDSWAESTLRPSTNFNFDENSRHQPYFKLHGSSNWITDQKRLLVLGGDKVSKIASFKILSCYFDIFKNYLNSQSKLMIIGYGFQDYHINDALEAAVKNGLKIFVISPHGANLALEINKKNNNNKMMGDSNVESIFKQSLIGASRSNIKETFKDVGSAEYKKIMRFFDS